jgi:tetratricopeptide (TPR) repeat protein
MKMLKIWGILISFFFIAFADETFDKLMEAKKYSEALDYADKKIPTASRDAALWVKIGKANLELGLTEKALASFLVATRLDEKNYDAHLGNAMIYNKLKQYQEAAASAKKALDLNFTQEAAWEYARACIALNKSVDAKKALEKVVESDPSNITAAKELGLIYYSQKNYPKALELLKQVYLKQKDPEIAYKIGLVITPSESAIVYLKYTKEKKPGFSEASLELAKLYYKTQNYNLAAEEFETIYNINKSKIGASEFYMWATCLNKAKAPMGKTVSIYENYLEKTGPSLSEEALEAHSIIGSYKMQNKNYQSALENFEIITKSTKARKILPEINMNLAICYEAINDSKKAIFYLEKEISENNANVEAYSKLAELYSKTGQAEKSKTIYEKMLSLNPNNPKTQLAFGNYNLKLKKYQEALRYFQKSYTLERTAEAAQGMAISAFALGQMDMARDASESALHIDPELWEPRIILSKIYMQEKNYKEAKDIFEFMVRKEPNNKEYWVQLAICCEQIKDTKRLAEVDNKILSMEPKNIESRKRLANYLFSEGNLKGALEHFKELSLLSPKEPEIFKNLYEISLKLNNEDDVAKYLKAYLALKPQDVAGQKALGDMLYKKNDKSGALAAYRSVVKQEPNIKGVYKIYIELLGQNAEPSELMYALNGAISVGEADAEIYAKAGALYLKQGQCPKAIEMLKKSIQIDPRNTEVVSMLAECQAKTGNIDEAIVAYEQVIALNDKAVEEFKYLGNLYMQQKKTSQAVNAYKRYLAKKPNQSAIAKLVADYEFEQKKYEEAEKYYSMITGSEAKEAETMLKYGQSCYYTKNYKKAKEILSQVSSLLPKNPNIYKMLFDIVASDTTAKKEAVLYLQKYAALIPEDAKAQKELGDMMYEIKNYSGALAAYKAALAADSTIKGFYKRYVELVGTLDKPEELLKAITAAINAGEADASMYSSLGDVYAKQGKWQKAIEMYQNSQKLDPRNTKVLSMLAMCQAKNNQINEAVISYEQVIALNDKAVDEYKALAELYTKQKKTSQAISMYKKYLERKSNDYVAARLVGDYSFEQKNYEDAVKYYSMVSGEEAQKSDFLFNYGQACYFVKDYKKALEIFNKLALITPKNANLFKMMYDITKETNGKNSELISYLKKYVSLKPEDAEAFKNLGDIYYEEKNYDAALESYNSALKANPQIKGFYKNYVEIVSKKGVQKDIIEALKGAISAGEADANMYMTLGNVYKDAANYSKAIEMYTKVLQLDSKNIQALSLLGYCQDKNGDIKGATITYEQVIALSPQSTNDYKALASLYLKQKKENEAIKMYKKCLEKDPNDYKIAEIVGEYEFKNNDYDEAYKYLSMVKGPEAKTEKYLLLYGKSCYLSKSCTKSAEIFKELAKLSPNNPEVFKILYDISKKAQNNSEALIYLKKYAALNASDAEAQKNLGNMLYEQKDKDGALLAYKAAIKANPSIKGFYKRYVELVMEKGTSEEIAQALASAVASNEADASMYASLGNIYQKKQAYSKAAEMYQKALSLEPKNTLALSSLAYCQAKTGQINDAVISYEQTIAMKADAKEEYKELGDLYLKQQKTSMAMSMYKKYLEKKPQDNEVANIVANNAFDAKDYEEAKKYYEMMKGSQELDYLYKYGVSCYYTNDYKKAISLLANFRSINIKATKKHPATAEVLKVLALAYDKSGNKAEALEVYSSYLSLSGIKDAEASLRRAQLTEEKDPAAAAKLYEENTSLYPNDYKNYLAAGLYYAKQKTTINKALTLLKKCSELADTIPQMWFELGQIYGKLNKDKEEIEAYRKFIQLDPKNADAASKIGGTLLAKNKVKDALSFLEMANTLKPNDANIMIMLAQCYIKTNKSKDALALLEKADKIKTDDPAIKETLFELYKSSGQTKKALDIMQEIVQKKRDSKTLLGYAEALFLAQDYAKAENTIKDITATDPENISALMLYGKIQTAQNKLDDAVETYKEISYINPNYAPAIYERAEIYFKQNKLQWAKTFYERVLKADPNFALAELGLAKVAKAQKNNDEYNLHLEKALKMAPDNEQILEEAGKKK